jgi:zona occludens toxin
VGVIVGHQVGDEQMIYLVTGVPGSGKTLYTVSTLIPSLIKKDDGSTDTRRLLVDGIPDLALDHVPMAPSDASNNALTCKEGNGFANWHEWVSPGDVLVVDEIQRYLRPRSFGSKVPDCVQHLETHRHHGIDILFITQNPMLMDQNIRRLVGRHQHLRRIWGFNRALIYEWDGCQADVNKVSGATKQVWSYPKNAFLLYKSSELHTKQKHKIPVFALLPFLLIFVLPYLLWRAYSFVYGEKVAAPVAAPTTATQSAAPANTGKKSSANLVYLQFGDALAGCVVAGDACSCVDHKGFEIKPSRAVCDHILK